MMRSEWSTGKDKNICQRTSSVLYVALLERFIQYISDQLRRSIRANNNIKLSRLVHASTHLHIASNDSNFRTMLRTSLPGRKKEGAEQSRYKV
jgi:hypothetical protein